MITSKVCENFTCGINDQKEIEKNTSKLPEGALKWLNTFIPISYFEEQNKKILLLTGTINAPYNGINIIVSDEIWYFPRWRHSYYCIRVFKTS